MKNQNDNMEIEIMEAFTSMKSDREIGMPDIEQELAKLTVGRYAHGSTFLSKIASTIAILVAISGIAVAAIVNHQAIANFFSGYKETIVSAENRLKSITSDSIAATPKVIEFENSELAEIMNSIGNTYKTDVRFKEEEKKHIHLHFQYNTSDKLDQVIFSLNMFEKINIKLVDGKLEVE